MTNRASFLLLISVLGALTLSAGSQILSAKPLTSEPDTTWFTDAGFGIFLHWGAYSTTGGRWKGKERLKDLWGEWIFRRAAITGSEYEDLARRFHPAEFHPADWARIFRDSGAKYVILTAKHHEGFAMYHSAASKFNSFDWPNDYHGEPVKELGDAVRADGLKYGVYYSQQIDWHHVVSPDKQKQQEVFDHYFKAICLPQVRELLTGYGPMAVMWFDIGLRKAEQASELKSLVRSLQPEAIISERIGCKMGDYSGGGDNEVPSAVKAAPWESCMTLNQHWASYPQDVTQKSPQEVIRLLADIRSKGGNMLLDIGPEADGTLAPRDIFVLRMVGKWLNQFGASIYGVLASPLAPVPWGRVTKGKDNTLYLHLFDIPSSGKLTLPGVKGKVESASFLGDPQKTPLSITNIGDEDHAIDLSLGKVPASALDKDDTVIVVKVSQEAVYDTVPLLDHDFSNVLSPALATCLGKAKYKHQRKGWSTAEDPAIELARYDDHGILNDSQDAFKWTFRTDASGDFHVVVYYADPNPRAAHDLMNVDIDGESFSVPAKTTTLSATGDTYQEGDAVGNNTFLAVRLGTVAFGKAGLHQLKISVHGRAGAKPVVINKVVLVPSRTTPLEQSVDRKGKPLNSALAISTDHVDNSSSK